MRPSIPVNIQKNKENGTYDLIMSVDNLVFPCRGIEDKETAIDSLNRVKERLDAIKLVKLKGNLTDSKIQNMAYERYPISSNLGYTENMLRDLLRTEFFRTSKFIRDFLFKLELEIIKEEESEQV